MSKIGRYLLRRPHDPSFEMFKHWPGDGLFLDIGANVGQSAMSFRLFNRRSRILSLEPNPELASDLRLVKLLVRRFDYMTVAAGDRMRMTSLYVPQIEKVAITGEASLRAELASDTWWNRDGRFTAGIREVPSTVVPVDALHLDPRYVKIDAEGVAVDVLEGMHDTIRRCHPIFLIEGGQGVVDFLGRYDYTPFTYRGEGVLGPWDPKHSDVFLLPRG